MAASWSPQPPPPAPPGFEFDREIPGCKWHQRWELFRGVFTPGRNDVVFLADRCGIPRDLRGLRVLDVGAWNGGFSFECERRGAAEVVALTMEAENDTGFARLARLAGSRVVRQVAGTSYRLDPDQLGAFDLVLFFGVLYHLRYPLLAIDNLRNVCCGTVLIETHVIDDDWKQGRMPDSPAVSLARVSPRCVETPLWRYYPENEYHADRSNMFGPNCQAVVEAFASAGFACRLLSRWGGRASFEATARTDLRDALRGCYELYTPANDHYLRLNRESPAPTPNPPRAEVRPEILRQPAPHAPRWRRAVRRLLGGRTP